MSPRSTGRSMGTPTTRTEPERGSGDSWVQGFLDLRADPRTVDDHIAIVYRCLQVAVEVYEAKQATFADDAGANGGDFSMRLRRQIHKGQLQRAFLDYLGVLGMKPAAREAFLRRLAAAWGWRIEREKPLTAVEKLQRVLHELPLLAWLLELVAGPAVVRRWIWDLEVQP